MVRFEKNFAQALVAESRQPKRMRARRLRIADLKLGEVRVRLTHSSLGDVDATAEDISLHGVALVVPAAAARRDLVLIGDRVDHLVLSCADGRLYDGTATVRRVNERGAELVLGLEVDSSGIDLSEVYRCGTRVDFAKRWEQASRAAKYEHIVTPFKEWVGSVRTMLEGAQRFLDFEDRTLASEDLRTAQQARQQYLAVIVPDLLARINEARGELAKIVEGFTDEQHAAHRAYSSLHLSPFLKQAPFVRRALEKPLGYAGDYEMMNMLYRDPAEGETLLGKALNFCFTEEPAAQANKNRIDYIGRLIRQALKDHPEGRVRIASLGCGPAREIEALLHSAPSLGARLDIALIDQEDRAIAHCEQTLAPLAARTGARIRFIREGIRNLLSKDRLSQKLGHCALIYSAGLFDYLEDRAFSRILSVLYEALVPGGLVAVGNVASNNPSRWVMEYFAEWFLIHRSPADLLRLSSEIAKTAESVDVDAEATGINLFLRIRR
ncbi:MAG: SAM-dependent methyltransferase [Myxococcales bacterium]|nr:SAM-dependent methyltransferase [Myxococcales bacterium]